MKLADYLKHHGISRRRFAERIGADESSVSYWCNDQSEKLPSWKFLKRIATETDYEVLPNDFIRIPKSVTRVRPRVSTV